MRKSSQLDMDKRLIYTSSHYLPFVFAVYHLLCDLIELNNPSVDRIIKKHNVIVCGRYTLQRMNELNMLDKRSGE